MSRPPKTSQLKLTPEKLREFLDCLKVGMFQSEAAKVVGVGKSAISNRKARHPEFVDEIEQAEAWFERICVATITKSTDWRAKAFLLERRFPSRWSPPLDRAKIEAHRAAMDAAKKDATPEAVADSTIAKWLAVRSKIPGREVPVATVPMAAPALAAPAVSDTGDSEGADG